MSDFDPGEAIRHRFEVEQARYGASEDFAWPVGLLSSVAVWDHGWVVGCAAFFAGFGLSLWRNRASYKAAERAYEAHYRAELASRPIPPLR